VKITFLFRERPVTLNAIRDAKVTAFERTVTALLRDAQKKLYFYLSILWLKASQHTRTKVFPRENIFLEQFDFYFKLKTKDQCALVKERVNLSNNEF